MASKVTFRARALDQHKPMPVYLADELVDLAEYAAVNRAVPAMPTGMEKEEEMVRVAAIFIDFYPPSLSQ
jgi:enhancer of polycomb-like protein